MIQNRRILKRAMLAAAFLLPCLAKADNLTWTGATNNLWNTTDANWSGDDTVFADGDAVLFSGTSGVITEIVSRSPASTTVTSDNKVTFATGIMGDTKPIGGPSILTGALVKNGSGELELGDPLLGQQFGAAGDRNKYSNSFSSVTVNAGTLRIRSRAALGTGTVTLAGGSKFIQASEEGRFNFNNEHIDNNFVLSGGLVEFPMAFGNDNKGSWFRNGVVSGPGGIRITGSSRSLAMSGNNTYEGGTTIDATGNAGLLIASYTALGTGPFTANQNLLTSGGGGFMVGTDLPGNTTYPDGVTNAFVINAGKFLNVYCTNATATLRLSGPITGGGTLNKWQNASTLILSGNNSYGGTILAAGTIVCETENSLGTGALSISSGAKLQLDFVGSANATSLSLGGMTVANGTWGSSASPADNRNDTYFSGLGIVTVGPPKTPTTTSIAQTAGTNPTDIGLSVTFTATVSGGSPTGTVAFYDGLTQLGTSPLDGSFQASVSTTALPEGTRNIVAQYQGDATYASSTSTPLPVQVVDERAATTTTLALTSGTNPLPSGASVTYTATVAGSSPTGTVEFYDRDNLIGSSALSGSFEASVSTSALPNGVRRITALYSGDLANKPGSGIYTQHVDAPAGNGKLKVFILAGQSNMQGHGRTEFGRNPENLTAPLVVGGIGSLRGATTRDPLKYGYLLDPDVLATNGLPRLITRDDVYVSYWDTVSGNTAVKRAGYLDAMFGVSFSTTDGRIGPEYGFGHVVGAGLGDKVLLIKTAWGGKSLKVDFRPPSSGGTTGPFYLDMVDKVHTVLDNLATYYPDYDGGGYELCGFGWHQGWNDRIDGSAVAEYEANLTHLINDIRDEFNVPDMPFVIANTGMANAPSGPGTLIDAQGNVSDPAKHPEFAGTVTTVDTRPFDYGAFQSPIDQGYHWNGNGEGYFQIGEAMGEAMLELLSTTPQSAFQTWAADPAQGLTKDVNDGPLDDPDFDGIHNLLEFVLRGNPMVGDSSILPTGNAPSAGTWTFEYDRNKDSVPDVAQVVEHTTDFVVWTKVTIPLTSSGSVTITPGVDTDHVSVAIPVSGSNGFARLVATGQ